MSDTPPPGLPPAGAPWPPAPPMTPARPSRWPTFAALTIAVIALGFGVVGWFRPVSDSNPPQTPAAPIYTDQQIADSQATVCAAHDAVHESVNMSTNKQSPVASDEIGGIVLGVNARLTLYAGGGYLLNALAEERATPTDLVEAVRSLADSMQELAIVYLAEKSDSVSDPIRYSIGTKVEAVDRLCK